MQKNQLQIRNKASMRMHVSDIDFCNSVNSGSEAEKKSRDFVFKQL